MPAAEPAEAAGLNEAFGQNVQRPATGELDSRQPRRFRWVSGPLVFAACPEGDRAISVVDQPSVGESGLRSGTAPSISRPARAGPFRRWRLDEDHPWAIAESLQHAVNAADSCKSDHGWTSFSLPFLCNRVRPPGNLSRKRSLSNSLSTRFAGGGPDDSDTRSATQC